MERLKQILFGHFSLAVVMALITWFGIREVTKHERILTVDQVTFDPGDDWVVLERSTEQFVVSFRGSKSEILQLNASQVRIDLGKAAQDAGEEIISEVQLRDVVSPGGVSAVNIEPKEITIRRSRVERSDEITLTDRRILTLSDLPKDQVSVAPAAVTITIQGKENSLTEANIAKLRVFVDCVDVAVDSSADVPIQVKLPAGISLISVEPETANVQISSKAPTGIPEAGEPTLENDVPPELKLTPSTTP